MYMTSRHSEWISSDIPINSSNSLIARVIFPLYHNQELDLFILYNNESPKGKSNPNKGHTKGVVLMNNEGGLWFIHSVPKFPLPEKYQFPETGLKYGQSFLCISLNLENMDKVGLQLQYNEPSIYSMNIPNQFHTTTPNLVAAANNVVVSKSPWYHQSEITSLMGTVFISFAKSNKFGKDIYEDWVAPVLQYNLSVETWPNGPGRLNSDCSKPFKVKNIQSIYLSKLNLVFNSTHDHSKWAIAIAKEKAYWICIGDINRAVCKVFCTNLFDFNQMFFLKKQLEDYIIKQRQIIFS
ncbi:hypothetical protein WA026_013898 [Henosepilachna vigintioctopunctata]|uniref:Plancitoxin-1 n=1 Tax=Henosepilachna vigintioctopunctata TaxID=420089 RepID=A0AAW1UB52_9CUCU